MFYFGDSKYLVLNFSLVALKSHMLWEMLKLFDPSFLTQQMELKLFLTLPSYNSNQVGIVHISFPRQSKCGGIKQAHRFQPSPAAVSPFTPFDKMRTSRRSMQSVPSDDVGLRNRMYRVLLTKKKCMINAMVKYTR